MMGSATRFFFFFTFFNLFPSPISISSSPILLLYVSISLNPYAAIRSLYNPLFSPVTIHPFPFSGSLLVCPLLMLPSSISHSILSYLPRAPSLFLLLIYFLNFLVVLSSYLKSTLIFNLYQFSFSYSRRLSINPPLF